MIFKLAIGAVLFATVACSHLETTTVGRDQIEFEEDSETEIVEALPLSPDDFANMAVFPHETNEHVEKWVNYFQGRGREHMTRYLERSTRYLPYMQSVFKKNGLPEDLVYVALIESGFNSSAKSRAAAVGYWQFMAPTGRSFGLRINNYIDERRDPVLSTDAASRYLKGLYSIFGNWYLAIAAYNAGENRVKGVVMKHYTRNFWELIKKEALHPETLNYVPKFLAARMIAKDPEKYGFVDLNYEEPLAFEEIESDKPVSLTKLAQLMNVSVDEMKRLNPAYKGSIAQKIKDRQLILRVPVGTQAVANEMLAKAFVSGKDYEVAPYTGYRLYRIGNGDTLSSIAQKFGTSINQLRSVNQMGQRSFLKVGQKLKIPVKASQVLRETADESGKGPYTYYLVRKGDNLSEIARKFNTSLDHLVDLNGFSNRTMLRTGATIKVPATKPSSYVEQTHRAPRIAYKNLDRETSNAKADAAKSTQQKSVERVHVITSGDTLIQISQKYDVPLHRLIERNGIARSSKILAGTKIVIP